MIRQARAGGILSRIEMQKIDKGLTFIRMSLYLSFCWRSREFVEPTMYDFVP